MQAYEYGPSDDNFYTIYESCVRCIHTTGKNYPLNLPDNMHSEQAN